MDSLGNFPFIAAFAAGFLSFISPCVLPLIPAFISFITGTALEDIQSSKTSVKTIFFKTLTFTAGFSAVFIALGMSASWLGGLLGANKDILRYIGGAVVILFGFHLTGVLKISFLNRQAQASSSENPATWAGIFFVGAAFALGWTPCIGPILASILILASTDGSVSNGFLLLVAYSLGLALPFLFTALFINWFLKFFSSIKKYYAIIEKSAGILLIIIGILLITNGFSNLTIFILQRQ